MNTFKKVLLGLTSLQAIAGSDATRFPVKKSYGPDQVIQKRSTDGSMLFEITNKQYFYTVDIVMGSNNQSVIAVLDTGSSDLWVMGRDYYGVDACQALLNMRGLTDPNNATQAPIIQRIEGNCQAMGVYDPFKSTTFERKFPEDPFLIMYGDGSFADGYWGSDKLTINGVELDDLLFGIASFSDSLNVCGIGFIENENSNFANSTLQDVVTNNSSFVYPNLPYMMKDQGLTKRVSYSLFLNTLGAQHGDLLFGAVDRSKYLGDLHTIPLIKIADDGYDHPVQFDVTLQGLGYVSETGEATTLNNQYFAALADSGTTIFNAPQELTDMMAAQVGAVYDNTTQVYFLDCPSTTTMDQSAFVLKFGGENYFFPYRNFVIANPEGNNCALQIAPYTGQNQEIIMGDNILTSLYVVYDLENYELSIARSNYAGADVVDESEVVAIPPTGKAIPGAIKAPGYYDTWVGPVEKITSGGDIFNGAKTVSNPWATTATSYYAPLTSSNQTATSMAASTSMAATSTMAANSSMVANSSMHHHPSATSTEQTSSAAIITSSGSPVSSGSVSASSGVLTSSDSTHTFVTTQVSTDTQTSTVSCSTSGTSMASSVAASVVSTVSNSTITFNSTLTSTTTTCPVSNSTKISSTSVTGSSSAAQGSTITYTDATTTKLFTVTCTVSGVCKTYPVTSQVSSGSSPVASGSSPVVPGSSPVSSAGSTTLSMITTNAGVQSTGSVSSTGPAVSTQSNNGAGMIAGSLIPLLAALFV